MEYIEVNFKKKELIRAEVTMREQNRMMVKADLEKNLEEKALNLKKLEEGREEVTGELLESKFRGKL